MIKQGDIYLINLDPTIGHEIKKTRPCIVVSNNIINRYSPVIVIIPLTTNIERISPSHTIIPNGIGGLKEKSKAVTEHIKSIDRKRLVKRLGRLPCEFLEKVFQALNNTFSNI